MFADRTRNGPRAYQALMDMTELSSRAVHVIALQPLIHVVKKQRGRLASAVDSGNIKAVSQSNFLGGHDMKKDPKTEECANRFDYQGWVFRLSSTRQERLPSLTMTSSLRIWVTLKPSTDSPSLTM